MIKLKMPKMPKVKMPDVKGKVGKLTKAVGDKTKGAVKLDKPFEIEMPSIRRHFLEQVKIIKHDSNRAH